MTQLATLAPLEYLDDLATASVSSSAVLREEATLSNRRLKELAALRIHVHAQAPRWLTEVRQRLEDLLALPENWDSYGGRPISHNRVAATLSVLSEVMSEDSPVPTIVPCSDGGVQLEWHRGRIDLEVEVVGRSTLAVLFEDLETGEEWEKDVTDPAEVEQVLRLIVDRETAG